MNELSLGRKIYVLREERKLSQSKLEVEAGLSFGTISRIENGVINPTKETIIKIAAALELLDDEYHYLISPQNSLPDIKDVKRIVDVYSSKIDSSAIPMYLMDCKFRVWYWNDKIVELLGLSKMTDLEGKRGQTTMRILLSKDYGVRGRIPMHLFPKIIKEQVEMYKIIVKKYKNEQIVYKEIRELSKDETFNELWRKELKTNFIPIANEFYIYYNRVLLSIDIVTNFLNLDNRFMLVSYYPRDQLTVEQYARINETVKANQKKK